MEIVRPAKGDSDDNIEAEVEAEPEMINTC